VHGDRRDPHLAQRPHHTDRDLPAIGYEYFAKHDGKEAERDREVNAPPIRRRLRDLIAWRAMADSALRRKWQSKTKWGLGCIALGVVAAVALSPFGMIFVLGESASAEVVDIREGSRQSCAPVLVYRVNRREHRAFPNVMTAPCPWAIGDETTAYFYAETPDEPRTAGFLEVAGPFVPPAILLLLGAITLLRKPRASEILESAPTVTADRVTSVGRRIVRVRGTLEARGPLLDAPLTARPCIAYWARVSRRSPDGRLTEIATVSKGTALSVRDSSGTVDLPAGAPLRLKVTADTSGDSTSAEHRAAIDRFVDAMGARSKIADLGADELVWYEAAFIEGDTVELAGWARSTPQGATLDPIEHGVVFSKLA
jgi:hypothetical protein